MREIYSLQLQPSHKEDIHTYTFVHLSLYSYGRSRTYGFEGLRCVLRSERVERLRDDHPARQAFVKKHAILKK